MRWFRLSAVGFLVAPMLLATGAAAQPPPPAPPPILPAPPPPPPPPPVAGAPVQLAPASSTFVEKPDLNQARKPNGWDPRLSLGATGSFANNSNVVGQINGSSFAFGLKLDAGVDLNHFAHEWRSTFGVNAGTTKTPAIDEFVKTADTMSLESIYLYHVVDWFGPFGRASMQTSMFRGAAVTPIRTRYLVTRIDGTIDDLQTLHLSLSDPFKPMTLKQSLGVFFQPYRRDKVAVELRAGAGAQEVLANDQLAINDDSTTLTTVEVKQLEDVNQIGPELAASVWGSFAEKRVTYRVDVDALTPLAHTKLLPGDKRNAFELTNVQIDAGLSFKLVEWASLDYQFRALRQPEVVDVFQVQNSLLLTFGISLGKKAAPPPNCPQPPAPPPAAPAPP